MSTIKFNDGGFRTYQKDSDPVKTITSLQLCESELDGDIALIFNNATYNIAKADTVQIEGVTQSTDPETRAAAIRLYLSDFFKKAPATGGGVIGDGVTDIVVLTQSEYNALDPKDSETLYFITA